MSKQKRSKAHTEGLQLALPPTRAGKMGSLGLGRDYMAGVLARARRLDLAVSDRGVVGERKR